jgi:hypothetical protein
MSFFLIDLFKKAKKGDAYRIPETPDKYTDKIAALNAGGQITSTNNKVTTANLSKISNAFTPSSNNLGKIPGA